MPTSGLPMYVDNKDCSLVHNNEAAAQVVEIKRVLITRSLHNCLTKMKGIESNCS